MTLAADGLMDPELKTTLDSLKADILSGLNVVKVGKINSFDGTKKTAEIQILFKRMLPDESVVSFPVLVDCPVYTPQGGGGALEFPIAAGDNCLVLFSDRNIDAWFRTGAEGLPFDGRVHDLSDGFALVGVNSLTSALVNYKTSEAVLSYAAAQFSLKGGKAGVKNAATDLLTLLNGLIDVIAAASTIPGGGPLNAATIAALTAYKTTLATLLYVPI